jgi:CRP-like cAMP-binding protein
VHRSSTGPDGAERLKQIHLFEDLSLGQRQMLARLVDQVSAVRGETIMDQGTPGYEFMVLEQGRVEVLQDGVRIRLMGPGEFFGELAVLDDGAARTASVVALSDVQALVFTAHFMREMHDRLPELGARIDRVARERVERDELARRSQGS